MKKVKHVGDLKRRGDAKSVPIKDIYSPEWAKVDDEFIRKYTQYLSGNLIAHVTRINISYLRSEFYDLSGRKIEVIPDKKNILDCELYIRSGSRMPIYVYKVKDHVGEHFYSCTESAGFYYAYKKLGLKKFPLLF